MSLDDCLGSYENARELVDRVRYKPGWAIDCRRPLNPRRTLITVRLSWLASCAVTGKLEIRISAEHMFDIEHMTGRHLINRILWAIKQAEEHETLEFFKLDGVAIYDPHK